MQFSAEMIAAGLGGEIVGNKDVTVSTFAKIEEGHPGAISFLANPKYEPYLYTTDSSIVIVNRSLEPKGEVKATLIKVDDAYGCFAKLLEPCGGCCLHRWHCRSGYLHHSDRPPVWAYCRSAWLLPHPAVWAYCRFA